jgi:PAS domain S-box-containing protein
VYSNVSMEERLSGWNEDTFRRLVESIDEYAILLLDPQGNVRTWNRGAERIKGYKANEIIGRHFSIFYPERDLLIGKPAFELEEAMRVGRYEEEDWRVRQDGSQFWASVVITALRDDEGKLWGFGKITRDLTERKLVSDELMRAETARGRAEEAARRALLLDEVMRALLGHRRIEETLQHLGGLLVRRLADCIIVDYRSTIDGEVPRRLSAVHLDTALAERARQLRLARPADAPDHPVARVLATARALVQPEVTPAFLAAQPEDARELLQQLQVASFMIVPLTESRGQVVGTIWLLSSQPRRRYDEPDLLLARDVAQRASLAIENAQLWELETRARRRAEEVRLRFEAVLQQMPAGAAIAESPTGKVILTNHAYREILFPPVERSPNDGAPVAFDADGKPLTFAATPLGRAVFAGETVSGAELRVFRPDGSEVWISCNAGPIRDPHTQEVIAGIVAFSDVTLRKSAERGLRALAQAGAILSSSLDYQATLRNLAQSVVPSLADWCIIEMVDAEGELQPSIVAHVDPSKIAWAQSLAGRWRTSKDAAHGSPKVLRTLEADLYAEIPDELLQLVAHDEEHLDMLRRVGMTSALSVPIATHGKGIGVLSLIASESRRHFGSDDIEIALELARRAAIAVENARLFGEAQQAARTALAAVRARDEFISVASHELRTPLTALRMSTETVARLARRSHDELRERIGGKLELGLRQLDRLEALIDQLLDVSRLAEGRLGLTLEPVDLVALARELAERFADQLAREDTPLTLELPDQLVGRWDRSRLDQVLTNLLANALKYGRGRPITLTVSRDAARKKALVALRDQGIGIAPEDQVRIFDRYERAAPLHHFGGLGLGLWISRRMVEAMGGTILVSSSVGAGATFTVELPLENG